MPDFRWKALQCLPPRSGLGVMTVFLFPLHNQATPGRWVLLPRGQGWPQTQGASSGQEKFNHKTCSESPLTWPPHTNFKELPQIAQPFPEGDPDTCEIINFCCCSCVSRQ